MRKTAAEKIGQICKAVRLREGKSIREWADQIEVHHSTVYLVESGKMNTKVSYLARIKKHLEQDEKLKLLNLILEEP